MAALCALTRDRSFENDGWLLPLDGRDALRMAVHGRRDRVAGRSGHMPAKNGIMQHLPGIVEQEREEDDCELRRQQAQSPPPFNAAGRIHRSCRLYEVPRSLLGESRRRCKPCPRPVYSHLFCMSLPLSASAFGSTV